MGRPLMWIRSLSGHFAAVATFSMMWATAAFGDNVEKLRNSAEAYTLFANSVVSAQTLQGALYFEFERMAGMSQILAAKDPLLEWRAYAAGDLVQSVAELRAAFYTHVEFSAEFISPDIQRARDQASAPSGRYDASLPFPASAKLLGHKSEIDSRTLQLIAEYETAQDRFLNGDYAAVWEQYKLVSDIGFVERLLGPDYFTLSQNADSAFVRLSTRCMKTYRDAQQVVEFLLSAASESEVKRAAATVAEGTDQLSSCTSDLLELAASAEGDASDLLGALNSDPGLAERLARVARFRLRDISKVHERWASKLPMVLETAVQFRNGQIPSRQQEVQLERLLVDGTIDWHKAWASYASLFVVPDTKGEEE